MRYVIYIGKDPHKTRLLFGEQDAEQMSVLGEVITACRKGDEVSIHQLDKKYEESLVIRYLEPPWPPLLDLDEIVEEIQEHKDELETPQHEDESYTKYHYRQMARKSLESAISHIDEAMSWLKE